jgi:anti-sigma B factor antagonist
MEIATSYERDAVVLRLEGNLTFGAGERSFSDQVQSLLEEGIHRIIVDLGQVEFVDSSGLGALIRAHTSANRSDGALSLVRVGPQMRNLLAVARLTDVLAIFDNTEQALAEMGS